MNVSCTCSAGTVRTSSTAGALATQYAHSAHLALTACITLCTHGARTLPVAHGGQALCRWLGFRVPGRMPPRC